MAIQSTLTFAQELDRSTATFALVGFCNVMLRDERIPAGDRVALQQLVDAVRAAHKPVTPIVAVGDHQPERAA